MAAGGASCVYANGASIAVAGGDGGGPGYGRRRGGISNSLANCSNSPRSSRFGRWGGGHSNLLAVSSWSASAGVLNHHRQLRICAAVGKGGDDERGSSTRRRVAVSERSEACNEELLLFLFQLDLATRLQRALNSEQYEAAQQLREKIAEVEEEVARQRQEKMGSVSSKDEAQDSALTVLRLKADLQTAIDGEDYVGAAQLRDRISKLECAALAASARALVYQNLKYTYRLGQRVKHKIYGYLGVVCGMDPTCCESGDWVRGANVDQLPRGRNQPFYQVLVDVHEQPSLLVAYVAEDNLVAIEDGAKIERFDHPYTYFLFYGMDSKGDFIPSKQLREKYNAARHELPWEEDDET
ncbi:unnamed protein product [Calypogeia fissa]